MAAELPQVVNKVVAFSSAGDNSAAVARLGKIFADLDIPMSVCTTAEDAASALLVLEPGDVPLLVLDASDTINDDGEAVDETLVELLTNIELLRSTLPHVPRMVTAPTPPADVVIGAFRAGADDLVDSATATTATVANVLERVALVAADAFDKKQQMSAMRSMVEDFLRNLIKTERRSIDLEYQLAQHNQRPGVELVSDLDEERDPTVVLIEDDKEVADMLVDELEDAGVATFAFLTGEEAVENVAKMTRKAEAVDLALVDAKLPGISGIETIHKMREHRPHLPAIVMTGYGDEQTAMDAADVGVVGYVLKPFDNIPGLIERIKEQALQSMALAREQLYLRQIKRRHDKLLQRYRELAAEIDAS